MEVKIKYLDDTIQKVERHGDWIDLRAAETVAMRKGDYRLIPLGVAMELPEGYEALVVPRSSTFKNHKILMANSIGVIDNAYNGDSDFWSFPAFATEDTIIKKNDRICQFRIIKNQPEFTFNKVESLGNENRGGIGSTGVN